MSASPSPTVAPKEDAFSIASVSSAVAPQQDDYRVSRRGHREVLGGTLRQPPHVGCTPLLAGQCERVDTSLPS